MGGLYRLFMDRRDRKSYQEIPRPVFHAGKTCMKPPPEVPAGSKGFRAVGWFRRFGAGRSGYRRSSRSLRQFLGALTGLHRIVLPSGNRATKSLP